MPIRAFCHDLGDGVQRASGLDYSSGRCNSSFPRQQPHSLSYGRLRAFCAYSMARNWKYKKIDILTHHGAQREILNPKGIIAFKRSLCVKGSVFICCCLRLCSLDSIYSPFWAEKECFWQCIPIAKYIPRREQKLLINSNNDEKNALESTFKNTVYDGVFPKWDIPSEADLRKI